MFKDWVFLLFLVSNLGFGQIEAEHLQSIPLRAKTFVSIDNFGSLYFIDEKNAFHKNSDRGNLNYSNVQLGDITSANTFNTLKINLFYGDLNTIILLDNRLADIYRIDLNEIKPYKNVSHISTGFDSTLWFFNTDLQQLELYDYKTRKTRVSTLPVQSTVLDLKSDYNYAWLLTENYLYKYNYQGSLVDKFPNDGITSVFQENENAVISNGNILRYIDGKTKEIKPIELPNLLIKQFLLTNETLYIYDGEMLHQFLLKIK